MDASTAEITYEDKKIHDPTILAEGIDASPEKIHIVEELAEETGALKFVEDDTKGLVPDVQTTEGIVSNVLSVDDDPSLNPWTFRTFFLGFGLSIFGSVLAEIYYFKPQTLSVSTIFLVIISFILGEFMALVIPRRGWFRYLNPGPFNAKEHTAIQIMASTASNCALGTEVLAVQRLWYNSSLSQGVGIFILFSSQMLGYGLVGLVRRALVYPTDMFYPNVLPTAATLQALHADKANVKGKLRIFYIAFFAMLCWEIFPEYIFLMLIGFSIPCLAAPNSSFVSRFFGGANGNEGLGVLSLSFDWQYVGGTGTPMVVPIVATMNNIFGYLLCVVVFMAVYYGNVWDARNFPMLSQELYYANSTEGNYYLYNQTLILDANNVLNETALMEQGTPHLATTYVINLISHNMSIAATFTWMYFFKYEYLKPALRVFTISNIKSLFDFKSYNWKFWQTDGRDSRLNDDGTIPDLCHDPHFKAMLRYKEVPQWGFFMVLCLSMMVALVCIYEAKSGLPWWTFLIAIVIAYIMVLFLGSLVALFGFGGTQMQPFIQMIGSYMHPGNPMANMYFTLYGFNSVGQAFQLMQDLKLAQYTKLPPRSTFVAQILGCTIGAVFNYIMMNSIVTNQAPILKSIEGTAIWSGINVQSYNTQAISWGALAKYMFSAGSRYSFVPISLAVGFLCPIPVYFLHRRFPNAGIQNFNFPIFIDYMGWLDVGINSAITSTFIVALLSQFYFRKYHPVLFQKYNYLLAAGLCGGTQVLVFILSFATNGAAGPAHPFPVWWGNRYEDAEGNNANYDHCRYIN